MKQKIVATILVAILFSNLFAQTPVQLSSQPSFAYTETFADIANWTFSTTPANGSFTAGIGAAGWQGLAAGGTTTIPSATKITTNSLAFQTPPSGSGGYSGGVYKGTGNMVLLSTGTSDNTTSIAMDLLLDFTGLNAGVLSFDWASLNNSTGNRNGSLKVYASVDGTTFAEITAAQVNNFTNNNPTSGTISNIALPAIFNNSATARLRFYYHNGTGGTTGSRPRLSIDNISVSAVPTTPCTAPTAQPTNFTLGTVINNSASFSFTAASPAPQNYLVIMSHNNALTGNPVNGTTYSVGDNVGDGVVVALTNSTSITATGLSASTTYYFFVFSTNNACTGGPLYLTTAPLTGSATTLAGALPCVAPTTQPTNLVFTNIGLNSISGSFTAAAGTDEYLIVRSTSATFSGTLNNGTTYNGGNVLGNGSVVTRTAGTTFTSNSLVSGTTYYFYVFGLNNQNCTSGPVYNSTSPLTANATTGVLPTCVVPAAQPTNLQLSTSNTTVSGVFTPSASADGYLVVRSNSSTLSANPVNGTTYAIGANLGGGTVIQNSIAYGFMDYNLNASTTYYYFVFAKNSNCTGTLSYLTTNPLTTSITTTATPSKNIYFGNLHAHSSYSDGNQENTTKTPADDYDYAKNSLCMDFLGISEHNHSGAGMNVSNWIPGINQATAATTSSFLALHGQEWGVISNGGHVLIYGTNQLLGWETNNYNTYVAKSNYTGTPETTGSIGLFRMINTLGGNAFASFCHPDFSDYNNLSNIPYDATADSAVSGSAVASGVAFSTNTTYSDPPSAYGHLDYYLKMLSKGYHIGPFMDHDTHYMNFGRSNNNRLAVLSSTLTENDFLAAVKARNFYATEDCDTKVNFTINNQILGSIISSTSLPTINIYAIDPTNPTAIPTIKIMFGVAGNGTLASQLYSATGNTVTYTDFALASNVEGYYYADITIGGNRTITAPIWYTKTLAVPTTLLSFAAVKNNNGTIGLKWTSTNELNMLQYSIEKSANGIQFNLLETVKANNTLSQNNYSLVDILPSKPIVYYRLKMEDKNGKVTYSNIVSINFENKNSDFVTLVQNPANNLLSVKLNSVETSKAQFNIVDAMGRVYARENLTVEKGTQLINLNINQLAKGTYWLNVNLNKQKTILQFVKL